MTLPRQDDAIQVVDTSSRVRRAALWVLALAALFAFRLGFGLSRDLFFEDETQIFLMGLRYYATGAWPYFGPDVVWTKSEIPGALQALLVGLPFHAAAVPEAPYVLVNLISMAALAAFAWYVRVRVPLPAWLVWGWLMTIPWTTEFSTHILNPSYLLAPAIGFFIGFFEAVPVFRKGRIPEPLAFALMGASLVWSLQLHMSWPLLLPFAGIRLDVGAAARLAIARLDGAGFAAGAALTGLRPGSDLHRLRPRWRKRRHAAQPAAAPRESLGRRHDSGAHVLVREPRDLALHRNRRCEAADVPVSPLVDRAARAGRVGRGMWQPFWMLRQWFRTDRRSPSGAR